MRILKEDPQGNRLVLNGNIIKLHLKKKNLTKHIAEISVEKNYIDFLRVREKHLYENETAYGFNYEVLRMSEKISNLLLKERVGGSLSLYLIPISDVLEFGKFYHYKNQGFELQIFLKLDQIKDYRYEKTRNTISPY